MIAFALSQQTTYGCTLSEADMELYAASYTDYRFLQFNAAVEVLDWL